MLFDDLEKKKAIIFDFDNTIGKLNVNWDEVGEDLHKFYKERFNVDINFDRTHLGLNEVYRKLGKKAREASFEIFRKHEIPKTETFEFNETVGKFIEKNYKKHILVIWSGNSEDTINKSLGELKHCFKLIVGRESVNLSKPEPDGMNVILNKIKLGKEDFVFIGDGVEDKEVAKKCNIDFIHVDDFIKLVQ